MDEQSICIYCRGTGSSKEHVAPASIGGNCTIRCVCEACNGILSTVDKGVGEHSPVALSRIANTPATAFSTHLDSRASIVSESLGQVTVRVGNQMDTQVRPQLFLDGNRIQFVVMDRKALQELLNFIGKRITKGTLVETYIRIEENQKLPCYCMTRSNDAVVTASSNEEGLSLLRLLENNWENIQSQSASTQEQVTSYPQPSVLIEMVFKPNDEFRGVAKFAFETLALLSGPKTALEARFNPIRNYILGDVRLVEVPQGEVSVDTRFVQRLTGEGHMKFTETHAVLLSSSRQGLVAHVTLYGQNQYVVKLADSTPGPSFVKMYEFSHTKDGHQELSELSTMKRLLELGPEVFGFSKENASKIIGQLSGPVAPLPVTDEGPMPSAVERYFESLSLRTAGAVLVPQISVSIGDWRPKPSDCHANVDRWVAQDQNRKAVRGWIVNGPDEIGSCLFIAHSVVQDGTALLDITPQNPDTPPLRFLRHEGTTEEFDIMRKGRASLFYPFPIPTNEPAGTMD
jgi:hypothetical protein